MKEWKSEGKKKRKKNYVMKFSQLKQIKENVKEIGKEWKVEGAGWM